MKHTKSAFPTAQAGVALIEFAIAIPILIMVLIGIIEYGRYTYFAIEIGNAAHAGAAYGSRTATTGADATGMKNAAIADGQNAIFPLTASSVTAGNACACWTGTLGAAAPTASQCDTCTTGRQVTYAQVTVTGTISPLFNYTMLGLPKSWTVARTATIRIMGQ
ncbi:MAG TPA: TadE/TadG family type IV pilus assembly protein [Candidatus Baltobacteraceae bacterium]|nr:TadE/TadG family type IV pilus assembly protein [Candidatus Baltobacteraceae bacterium]